MLQIRSGVKWSLKLDILYEQFCQMTGFLLWTTINYLIKILVEIVEKINPYAYRLKIPSHIRTVNIFNVKHLILFTSNNSSDDNARQILMTKLLSHREDDVERLALDYLGSIERSKKLSGNGLR